MDNLTVLTIDDDQDILTLVEHLLKKKNYNVIKAEIGKKALEILDKLSTQIINRPIVEIFPKAARAKLSDALKQVIQLPEKSKIRFIADFRARPISTTVSAIFISSSKAGWVLALEDTTCN